MACWVCKWKFSFPYFHLIPPCWQSNPSVLILPYSQSYSQNHTTQRASDKNMPIPGLMLKTKPIQTEHTRMHWNMNKTAKHEGTPFYRRHFGLKCDKGRSELNINLHKTSICSLKKKKKNPQNDYYLLKILTCGPGWLCLYCRKTFSKLTLSALNNNHKHKSNVLSFVTAGRKARLEKFSRRVQCDLRAHDEIPLSSIWSTALTEATLAWCWHATDPAQELEWTDKAQEQRDISVFSRADEIEKHVTRCRESRPCVTPRVWRHALLWKLHFRAW